MSQRRLRTLATLYVPLQTPFYYWLKRCWEDHLMTGPWSGLKSLQPAGRADQDMEGDVFGE